MTVPSKAPPRAVDWLAVRQRMAEAMDETVALLDAASPDSGRQDADMRSSLLAAVEADGKEEHATGLVSFVLSGRRFAIDTRYVCEIVQDARVSPLPGTPAHVVGVHDLRGHLIPVFDLAALLDLRHDISPAADWVIVCGETQPEFLVLADGMPKVARLPRDEIVPAAAGDLGGKWGAATTSDGTIILDGDRLLNDRRFFLEGIQTKADGEDGEDEIP
ncbi:chemotaxis protein CheW [Sinorhizobium saheli]|uniref:CheW-like domain-containing protein n=2 Tax=Sinorhizobium saheli TaxID=36856 RepID=A0A178Y8V6_SINSA|nr:chemotaxis protein CheW [Sinorhizobium saheli]OAP43930.1 hypothetical protein ATB98_08610 [Sinorhizobium saheli]